MVNNIAFICYSHSSYSDVWDMFFGQLDEYLPNTKKYLFVDSIPNKISDKINVILYDNEDSYADRMSKCLKQINEEVCFFNHEDFILYDKPDVEILNKMIELVSEFNIDYIKLLKGDCHNGMDNILLEDSPIDNLYVIPRTGLSFVIQPSICKTESLIDIFTKCSGSGVHQIEIDGSNYVNESKYNGLFWYSGENKRGNAHWDSSVYPQGGMISKGKWNISEYPNELKKLSTKYDIELDDRGII
jgi:hypothetical protein